MPGGCSPSGVMHPLQSGDSEIHWISESPLCALSEKADVPPDKRRFSAARETPVI